MTEAPIELSSDSFDAYLKLLDEGCGILQENDDCNGLNSCITASLSPGIYRIELTTFGSGETGPYELRVAGTGCEAGGRRVPGDLDESGGLDSNDGMLLMEVLFGRQLPSLPCSAPGEVSDVVFELSDFNGSGRLDVLDVVSVYAYLFRDGPPHVLGSACSSLSGCAESVGCDGGP